MKTVCADCVYYVQNENLPANVSPRGQCRRFPPAVYLDPSSAMNSISVMPVVMADAFCGEFKLGQKVN